MSRDGNNQMLRLAWAVVEKENKHTWTMFVKCITDDLGIGNGEGLTLITDMQHVCKLIFCNFEFLYAIALWPNHALLQGMSVAIINVLTKCEHRMCARHILVNWAKDWMGLQRRQQFWKIDKSTFESQLRYNVENMK